jgi:hypothetical protein
VGEKVKARWVGCDYKGDRYYDAVITSIDADQQTCGLVFPANMVPPPNWDTDAACPMWAILRNDGCHAAQRPRQPLQRPLAWQHDAMVKSFFAPQTEMNQTDAQRLMFSWKKTELENIEALLVDQYRKEARALSEDGDLLGAHKKLAKVIEIIGCNVLRTEVTSRDVAELAAEMLGPLFRCTTGAQVPVDGGNERVIPQTVEALGTFGLSVVAAGHCTGFRAMASLLQAYGDQRLAPLAVGTPGQFCTTR